MSSEILYTKLPKAASTQPTPFKAAVPQEQLDEFKQLLKLSKIGPPTYENLTAETRNGKFGLTREWLINAKKEWETEFNWRSVEDSINAFPNYTTKIENIDLHFIALFSDREDAVPVIFMHGWPGSVLEFLPLLSLIVKQYSPETLPYHIIVPSLPGYAFSSGPPLDKNFAMADVARFMNTLMVSLGFGETGYVAQGGDIGSRIARLLGVTYKECKAVHLNFCVMPQPEGFSVESLTPDEQVGVKRLNDFASFSSAYAREQGSRPGTIGLVLSTNPLSLLAWIGEKYLEWTDDTPPVSEILASVTLYWLTETYSRAIYPYRESYGREPVHHGTPRLYIHKPLGYSSFPREVAPVPVSWAATTGNLVWSKGHKKGGHFAAFEQPQDIKDDVEEFIAQVWKTV
ncbi:putative epoxide hydrolase [Phlyctema vagabunda]|uniref:Epoxide hydrolase n=1 Tax=Phlyctema vagabunda TaxID=108571 RepID=A0ABR4P2G4_9HELO